MTARPARLVLVTGTGTEVGKTWFAAATIMALRERGIRVAARKPVQSFEPGAGPTDAEVLAAATGEIPDQVCPPHRSLPVPMAPPMAADALGRPAFTVAELGHEIEWPDDVDVGLVEGVGGPRSPLAADGDTVDSTDGTSSSSSTASTEPPTSTAATANGSPTRGSMSSPIRRNSPPAWASVQPGNGGCGMSWVGSRRGQA